jgi:4-amino-4-deoxy-L-arabinose transferase-like glycosyltransferase
VTSRRALPLASAVLVAALGLMLRARVLGDITHGPDAAAYRYQARIFAAGRWTAPATDFDQEFDVQGLIRQVDGRRFAKYTPGWPLVLAPFVRLGVPQLADPLLAAALVLLVHRLGLLLWPAEPAIAGLACVLALFSPFVVFMAASGLTHLPCAVAIAAAAVAVIHALRSEEHRPAARWGLAAGAAWGLAFLVRPFDGLLALPEVGLVCLMAVQRPYHRPGAALLGALPAAVGAGIFFLAYNRLTTGSAAILGYYLYSAKFNVFGGGPPIFTWANVRAHLPLVLATADTGLWGGLLPDLGLAGVALVLRRRDRRVWALAALAVVHAVGYASYYFFDLYFGPRNLFTAMPWILLLTAAGIVALVREGRTPPLRLAVLGLLGLQFAWGLAVTWPMLVRYYWANYWADAPAVVETIRRAGFQHALVLVRSPFYMSLHELNAVDLTRGPVVVARVTTPERMRRLLDAFHDRDAWVLDYGIAALTSPYYERWKTRHVPLTPPVAVEHVTLTPLDPARPEAQLFGPPPESGTRAPSDDGRASGP